MTPSSTGPPAGTELTPDVRAAIEAAREHYRGELAGDLGRFFEPRRERCPWCGSPQLSVRLRTPDLLQHKPGRFALEECATCGHIFQNPCLSPAGLDFYYRDFYDGAGQGTNESLFAHGSGENLERAEALRTAYPPPSPGPGAWLDVGTGYGHFCHEARAVWPATVFDGLDMAHAVEQGRARGWLDHAHQGMLVDLAASLAGRYDVVSMHHYLEHTRDPRAELDAAAEVLVAGGHLSIEVPDPASLLGRMLGRWWLPWFQPQHQHFVSRSNLTQALMHRGLTPIAMVRGSAHVPVDVTFAAMLPLADWAPYPHMPWFAERPTPAALRRYALVGKVAPTVFRVTYPLDRLRARLAAATHRGNAYRVLARKDGHR